MARTNRPELDELPEQKRNAILEGADAISTMRDFARRSFDMWMTIARGLAVLREVADQRTSRTAFKSLCKDHGYGTLNEATRSRLLLMAKHETAVRIWREAELTERQREHWNSPTSICNRCPTLRSAIGEASKNKPPPPPRKSNKIATVERAIDAISDYCSDLAPDERAAILTRIGATVTEMEPASPTLDEAIDAVIECLEDDGATRDEICSVLDQIAERFGIVITGLGDEPEPEPEPKAKKKKKKKASETIAAEK